MTHLVNLQGQKIGSTKPSAQNAGKDTPTAIAVSEPEKVPLSRDARIKELMSLPKEMKTNFLPPVGTELRIGPYVYKVVIHNALQLHFTAKLCDVVVEGIND